MVSACIPGSKEKRPGKRQKRLRRRVVSLLCMSGLLYLGLCGLLYFFQARLVYFPTKQMYTTPEDLRFNGMPCEDVALVAQDGTKLHAWYVQNPNARGVVLFCHGNAGNLSGRKASIKILHDLGLSVLIFDYRGFGKSEGSPSEAGTYQDARAAWDYLVQTRKVPADRIIILGRSLGGAVAARLASEHEPKALILESTFTSIPDFAAKRFWFLPVRWLCRFSYDTHAILPNIKSSVLVVHSGDDEIIPFVHGQKLFEAAGPPKTFLKIHGTHNGGLHESMAIYVEGLRSFLAEHSE